MKTDSAKSRRIKMIRIAATLVFFAIFFAYSITVLFPKPVPLSSMSKFIPEKDLPSNLTLTEEIFSSERNVTIITIEAIYKTGMNVTYFPTWLKLYRFSDEWNATKNYTSVIKDFQNYFSTVKFYMNNTLSFKGHDIDQYSVEIYGNLRNRMYTWRDNNLVFIAMGPDVDGKNLAFELIGKIYEK